MLVHFDLDAFYASVEQLSDPTLRDKPVVVGGRGERSVVSAASYQARAYGVHSAMRVSEAMNRCKGLVVLPVRMNTYRRISGQVMEIARAFGPIEPLSLDEAFIKVDDGLIAGRELRRLVRAQLGLAVSVGVADTKLVAKMASDDAKPDGLRRVPVELVLDYLSEKPVRRIGGIGPAAGQKLKMLGVERIEDLRKLTAEVLRSCGLDPRFLDLANGVDPRVVSTSERLSIGSEETLARDELVRDNVARKIESLSVEVARRARNMGLGAGTVTTKIKSSEFVLSTRAVSGTPTSDPEVIFERALSALEMPPSGVRLVGVSLSALSSADQRSMFGVEIPPAATTPWWEEVAPGVRVQTPRGDGVVRSLSHTEQTVEVVLNQQSRVFGRDADLTVLDGYTVGVRVY